MNILYSRGSNNRKSRYAIMTQVIKDGDQTFVHKIALRENASVHLQKIASDCSDVKNVLPDGFDIPKPEVINSTTLQLPFISGDNLEEELFLALRRRDEATVLRVFKEIENLILYKTTRVNPTTQADYTKFFGMSFSNNTLCSTIGLIDYNFDNFIRTKDTLYMVDYEWFFNKLAIPVDYLMSRLLYNTFAVKFKDTLQYQPTQDNPVTEVYENYLVPTYISKKYKKYLDKTTKMLACEQTFQNHIALINSNRPLSKPTYTYRLISTQTASQVEQMHLEKIGAQADYASVAEKFTVLQSHYNEQSQIISDLEHSNKVLLSKINRLRNIPLVKIALKAGRFVRSKTT